MSGPGCKDYGNACNSFVIVITIRLVITRLKEKFSCRMSKNMFGLNNVTVLSFCYCTLVIVVGMFARPPSFHPIHFVQSY